jgi:hypothetical protein
MTITSTHTSACFDAWINCENLLTSVAEVKFAFSRKLTKVLDECALICMGTFHALKSQSTNMEKFALLCMGICEECADVCEAQRGEQFQACARICRECSETLSRIAS